MAPVIEGHCPKCKLYNYMVKECFFCGHVFIKDRKKKSEKIVIEPVRWRVHMDSKIVGWRAVKDGKVICRRPTKREVLDYLKEKEDEV